MHSDIEIDKNLLGTVKSYKYQCSINLDNDSFSKIFATLVRLIQDLQSDSKYLNNIKGMDKFNFVQELPNDLQLFNYAVSFTNQEGEKELAEFSITTPFHSFDKNNILHSIATFYNPELDLKIDSPISSPEFSLQSFTFGMDFYGQSSFANWFFKTPVVLESFFVHADSNNLKIAVLNSHPAAKLILSGQLQVLLDSLENLFGYNLLKDLQKHEQK